MVKIENHLGAIELSKSFFESLVAMTAVSCFGVAALSPADLPKEMLHKVYKPALRDGVKVRVKNGKLSVDLHIIVSYGTNISAIADSIIHKVGYAIEEATGLTAYAVHIYVDGMRLS